MARRMSEETIQAYHDGELGWWARRRVERALAARPEVREQLQGLALVGQWVRDSQSAGPEPDLWADIARALPPTPATTGAASAEPGESWGLGDALGWLLRPAGAAVAVAAAAALVIFVWSGSEPAGRASVVQYLDPGDNSVMLLQGEDDATFIWVMEPVATDTSARESRAFI